MSMHHMHTTPSGGNSMMNHSMMAGNGSQMTHSTHMHHMTTANPHAGHMTTANPHAGHMTTANPHAGHGDPNLHTMKMFFHTTYEGLTVLFEEFEMKDEKSVLYACIVLFVVSILYEGLKAGREILNHTCLRREERSALYRAKGEPSQGKRCTSRLVAVHLLQSVLHVVQVAVSYMLMLAVMTFNLYICLAVVLGSGVGYLLFAWKRISIQDQNEHCN